MASRSHRGSRAAAARARDRRSRGAAARSGSIARALRAHEHTSAALLLALLVLVYLWPALVQGHVLSPIALLFTDPPWQSVTPHGIERWVNGDLGDVPLTYYPWDLLARRLIHAGTFPAWNPYAFGGTQLWANSQIAWLSPFSLPLWLLPLNDGLGVAAALKLWCAGFGTYLLARELHLGCWPGLVAGAAFALGSFDVVWLSYGVFVSVAAMLPWALWLTERILRRGRPGDGLALAGVVAVALLGGHPGTQVHVLAATALYALVRAALLTDADRRARVMRLGLVAGGTAVGLLAAAVVLVPAQLAAAGTVGAAARAHGAPRLPGSLMPPGVLRTVAFPDWWGRPSEGVYAGPGSAGYRERTFYAGAATLVLALLALLAPGGWRRKAPLALLGFLGLAIALRLPGLYQLVIRLPGFDRVQNSRIYLWFGLAAALLAAFGLQRAIDMRGRLGRGWLAAAAGLLAAVVAAAALAPGGGSWSLALRHAFGGARTQEPTALALASVLWWSVFAVALTAVVLLVRLRPRLGPWLGALVALVVALDMLHFAHGYQPMGPASVVTPPSTPAIAYLQRHRDLGRIVGIQAAGADWTTTYGLRDVLGFDAPQPSWRFFDLWRMMDPTDEPYSLGTITRRAPQVLGVLGGRYLVLPPGTRAAVHDLNRVYAGSDATIFANRIAAPRAFVARRVRVVAGERGELAAIGEGGFDPRGDATLRAGEVRGVAVPGGAVGSVRVIGETNASVRLRATLPRRAVVVLDDTWAPGWTVAVDGRPARALRADAVLRAVAVPAGAHEIAWSYRVPGLRLGAALSALGLLVAAAWGGALAADARRRRRAR